jgi:pyruvate dehydrogenase E1 component beta subunit
LGAGFVPAHESFVPLGKAVLRRTGKDATIVTHSYMNRIAEEAAVALLQEGIACAIVDLRTLAPLDVTTVAESVAKTRALVTLEEGQVACGVGSEVAFRVREAVGEIRVARVGALPAPVSSNRVLESAVLPDAARVAAAVRSLLR